jgi:hypothetical protein
VISNNFSEWLIVGGVAVAAKLRRITVVFNLNNDADYLLYQIVTNRKFGSLSNTLKVLAGRGATMQASSSVQHTTSTSNVQHTTSDDMRTPRPDNSEVVALLQQMLGKLDRVERDMGGTVFEAVLDALDQKQQQVVDSDDAQPIADEFENMDNGEVELVIDALIGNAFGE